MMGWAVDGAGSEDSFSLEFFLAGLLLRLLLRLLLSIGWLCMSKDGRAVCHVHCSSDAFQDGFGFVC